MRLIAGIFALSMVFAAGCGGFSTNYTPTNPAPRTLAMRAPETVEVFTSRPPERPYVDVGLIEVRQRDSFSKDTPAMIATLRDRAADLGCDAIVVNESTPTGKAKTRLAYHATCIAFTGPAPTSARLTPPESH